MVTAIRPKGDFAKERENSGRTRQLYFGDNLGILRQMPSNYVALCCTDPPFNSGRNYNIFLGAMAQETAFKDIWQYDDTAMETRADVANRAADQEDGYIAAERYLSGFDVMFDSPTSGKDASLRAYLTFMAPRIVEIQRVLKEDGSFYLHCDPNASHYLKGLCDVVFGRKQFRNEIVWCYGSPGKPKRHFPRKHDVILFYAKDENNIFNPKDVLVPHTRIDRRTVQEGWRREKPKSFDDALEAELLQGKMPFDWEKDIAPAYKSSREYLGYPTQKPRALYERFIKASSNEGDIVLDPFGGCGTTIDAAETLKRGWIGIDLTVLALEPIQERMFKRHHLNAFTDYPIKGYPVNMEEVRAMLAQGENSQRYKDFEQWAVTRLGLKPTRYVGDGGIDGIGTRLAWNADKLKETELKSVAEVKSGQISVGVVRAFRTSMRDAEATIGILIGINPISAGVKQEMQKEGTYTHNGQEYPRLQYWQITDRYFANPESIALDLKLAWKPEPINQFEAHVADTQQDFLDK